MPIEAEGETYYTAAEAARYLGVSRETFYQNTKNLLKTYQIGVLKRTYYRKSDIDQLKGVRPTSPNEEEK
jgi:excisionase family DNA binding protein